MKFKVYWSKGPHDNPNNGIIEVEATDAIAAGVGAAHTMESRTEIDAIIATDLEADLVPEERRQLVALRIAAKNFMDKVDAGHARSVNSYREFQDALNP